MSPAVQRLVHLLEKAIRGLGFPEVVMILNGIDTMTNIQLCVHMYIDIFSPQLRFLKKTLFKIYMNLP